MKTLSLRHFFLLPFSLLLAANVLFAQEPEALTLQQCLGIALKQSFPMQRAIQQFISDRKSFESQSMMFPTSIDLTMQTPTYNEAPIYQFNALSQRYEYFQLQTTSMESNLSLTQPVSITGGTFYLSGDVLKQNQTSSFSGATNYYGNFQISLRQPLFYPNLLKINRDQANLRLDETYSNFQHDELDVVYQVTNAFYTAYRLSQQEKITLDQVKQIEETYSAAKSKYGAGLIPEVDMLQSEVDLASSRNQSLNNKNDASRAKNALKVMLGLPLEKDVLLQADLHFDSVTVDQKMAIDKALANRAELLNAERNRDISRLDVDIASSRRHVKFDLTASYGLNRNDTLLASVFNDFNRGRAVALQVSVPIFDWGIHAREVESAEAQLMNADLNYQYTGQQIRQEIIDLVATIYAAQSRITVLAKTVEVAQKTYDITQERYAVGTASRNDLAQAQQRLTSARLDNLGALIDYQLGLADLERKTFWNFQKNEPVKIELPVE